ncbi:MAG TPA: tetratricopeptide repeat protein [Bryobacteraceae bacterium]|nr:tetratricopeptide repeat protein [Bryobacteraceae bacterium]
MIRSIVLLLLATGFSAGQTADPAYAPLQQAYEALRQKNYDRAVAGFEQAAALAPVRASIRKDFAYTLLKIGENEAARDQFGEAMRLDPADTQAALEYAFLCYETKQPATARRIFDRIRKTGNATAEQAFENIDRPLREGIERWRKALEQSPDNFSAHQELARLADQRDQLDLAAEHYRTAWLLKPGERSLMLDLGRVWKALGRSEEANAVLLAASRGGQARVAEQARELLPARYPYVYEFEQALNIDPQNYELRRELAYLHLQMGNQDAAEHEFEILNQTAPEDLLSAAQLGFLRLNRHDYAGAQPLLDQVLKGGDEELADRVRVVLKLPQTLRRRGASAQSTSDEAKAMAEKSLKAGYLKDALKYLTIAHENDPVDFAVMLKLGWLYNVLKDDREAVKWFNLASKSPDRSISTEAGNASRNLAPEFARFRTTAWLYPFFSTRWHDAFGYGQVKTELRLGKFPLHPYLSTRFVGDTKDTGGPTLSNPDPQYLSETSFIFALGLSSTPWHGILTWFEAGEAMKYLARRSDVGTMIPDYRGGVAYAKSFGHMLGGGRGLFFETNDDAVFVSRFQNDFLLYAQNRTGYTLIPIDSINGMRIQLYWNFNATADRLRQYWANYVETGPGVRFRFEGLPKSMVFSINFLRGAYTINQYNPRRPNFFDLRAGFWYAFTH